MPGAIVTCIVLITLLAFAAYKMEILVSKKGSDVSKQSFIKDLNVEPEMILSEYGFNVAFGLKKPLDPSIGKFIAYRVIYSHI